MASNTLRALSSVWNFTSASAGPLPPNPVYVLREARAWAKPKRRRTVIPYRDFPRWFAAVMNEHEDSRDFLLIALFTGMRAGEIKTLRWDLIDFEERTLTAPKTKNGDPLVLPLSSFLHDLLLQRRAVYPRATWVFPGPGKTGHLTCAKRFSDRVTKTSGVKFTLHDLRRTFATIANGVGVSTLALKGLLNHRTDNDITGGYVVATADDYRAPAERIATRILELANGERSRPEDRSGLVT